MCAEGRKIERVGLLLLFGDRGETDYRLETEGRGGGIIQNRGELLRAIVE
jgi:hypothetical protein